MNTTPDLWSLWADKTLVLTWKGEFTMKRKTWNKVQGLKTQAEPYN